MASLLQNIRHHNHLEKKCLFIQLRVIKQRRNKNLVGTNVHPMTIMHLQNTQMYKEYVFSFSLKPKLGINNVSGNHYFM